MQDEVERAHTRRHFSAAPLTAARGVLARIGAGIVLSLVVGCGGTGVAYDRVQINLPFVGKQHIAVAALDQRPSIRSGEHTATFTGTLRSDAAHSVDVATASGHAFADDVSEVVARGLSRSGYWVDRVTLDASLSEQQAFGELRGTEASHLALLVIREWETTTFQNTEVRYDLDLEIKNSAGALQGESSRRGSDQLPPAHSDSEDARERAIQSALEQKLNLLFAEPRVVSAFEREL